MDITKELQGAKEKQVQTVNRINELDAQRQELLREVLKLEGEIRALARLNGTGEPSTPPTRQSHKKAPER